MNTYTYYTDGAATMLKKGGQYLREAGGWAFVLLKNGKEEYYQSGGCPLTTNNEMELYAIYASIKDFLNISEGDDSLIICSDSAYCINIFTSWASGWQRRGWRKSDGKAIQNLEIIKTIWNLISEINQSNQSIKFKKVKGHSSDELNAKVDNLAVEAKKTAKITGKTTGYNQKPDKLLGSKQKLG